MREGSARQHHLAHRTSSEEVLYGNWCRQVVQRREGLRLHHPGRRGKDAFVHFSGIAGDGFRTLAEGAKVEYELGETGKGPQATNVRTI